MKTLDKNLVKSAASGRWAGILAALAPQLQPALERPGRHVACPVHGGRDGFRVFGNVEETGGSVCNTCGIFTDGLSTLMWVNGWDFPTALRAVGDYLNLRSGATAPKRKTVPERKTVDEERQRLDDARARASLNRVWGESVPLSDPSAAPAREYLARRGIKMEAAALLRFHRALGYYEDGKLVGEYPAILAKISSSDGNPVTIHRIYLTPEGKLAPVGAPKKMIPFPFDRKVVGGAIRLTPLGVSKILAIAEGVETALAVAEGTELPVWSSVNALLIEKFSPPEGVKTVLVFADKDLSRRGQEAAKSLVQRLLGSGIDAVAVVPKGEIPDGQKSVDWLDILNRYGKPGFPTVGEILASCKLRRAA